MVLDLNILLTEFHLNLLGIPLDSICFHHLLLDWPILPILWLMRCGRSIRERMGELYHCFDVQLIVFPKGKPTYNIDL
jgi:hypothetical protein